MGNFLLPSSLPHVPSSFPFFLYLIQRLGFPFSKGCHMASMGHPLDFPFLFWLISPHNTCPNMSHRSFPFYYSCVMCHMDTCIKWKLPHHMDLKPCAPLTSCHVDATWSCYVAPLLVSPDTRYLEKREIFYYLRIR